MTSIEKILNEIEMHERNARYSLADKMLKNLIKISYQANISDLGGYGDAFANLVDLTVLFRIPECNKFFANNQNQAVIILDDLKNSINSKIDSGMDGSDAYNQSLREIQNKYDTIMSSGNDVEWQKCFEELANVAATPMDEIDKGNMDIFNVNKPENLRAPGAKTREVPKIPANKPANKPSGKGILPPVGTSMDSFGKV